MECFPATNFMKPKIEIRTTVENNESKPKAKATNPCSNCGQPVYFDKRHTRYNKNIRCSS